MYKLGLSDREKSILNIVIENYIRQGKPIGSASLVENYNLPWSSATVRSVMFSLMEKGYLVQPHVSAGRIPTERGMRFYIDSLLNPTQLSKSKISFIKARFNNINGTFDEVIYETSIMLSDFSRCAGLATLPRTRVMKIKSTELIKIEEKKVLVIIVFEGGMIEQRVIKLDRNIPKDTLQNLSDYLNKLTFALTLEQVESILFKKLKNEKQIYRDFIESLVNLKVRSSEERLKSSVFINGQKSFFEYFGSLNPDSLKELFKAFEEKSFLLEILEKTMREDSTRVYIGLENGVPRGYSVIAAPYGTSQTLGTLGVLGPINMDYAKIIPLVNYTASLVSEIASEGGKNEV